MHLDVCEKIFKNDDAVFRIFKFTNAYVVGHHDPENTFSATAAAGTSVHVHWCQLPAGQHLLVRHAPDLGPVVCCAVGWRSPTNPLHPWLLATTSADASPFA